VLVASLCPLPVGVLRWRGPTPRITVIVKATYAIAREGVAELAASQLPLSLDVSDPHGDASALWYPSDFAPRKARADVTLVGGAFADPASALIPVQLLVDGLERRFVARAGAPSPYIPLSESYLHASLARNAATMAVGPRSLAARALGDAAAALDAWGLPVVPLAEELDFAAFNAAPPAQQMRGLCADATITLVGATREDGERRTVSLPGHRPRVFHAGAGGPGATPNEIALTVDTLWIDSFSEVCVLVWRGEIALAGLPERPQEILIALEEGPAQWSWPELRAAFASARRDRAIEPVDLGAPAREEPEEVAVAAVDLDGDEPTPLPENKDISPAITFSPRRDDDALAVGDDELPTDRPPPPATLEDRTGLVDLALLQRQRALPFGAAQRATPAVEERTGIVDLAQLLASQALPFSHQRAPIAAIEGDDRSAPDLSATPFGRTAPLPLRDEAPPRAARVEALPFAPPPALAPTITPRETPLLPLETYAAIKAELWRRSPLALPAVAAEHGLTEVEWLTHDLRYIEAIDAQAREGTSAIAAGVARAMAAAKRAGDDLDLTGYLALKSEIEAAGDAEGALKKRGLTRRALRRIERRWQPRNQS
jgi:uncharacterized protein DUF2169